MIVVDTSALMVIINDEPEHARINRILAASSARAISAATLVEATAVAQRWGDRAATVVLDEILRDIGIEVVAFDAAQAAIARKAYLHYGKGRGHKAQLNISDCFSYALAKHLDAPLLFKGNDFGHTDVKVAT